MPKFICQIKGNEKLTAARDEINNGVTMLQETMRFIKKQIEQAEQKNVQLFNTQWDIIEKELLEAKLIPEDYKKQGFTLELGDTGEELYMKSREERNNEHLMSSMPRGLVEMFKPIELLQ